MIANAVSTNVYYSKDIFMLDGSQFYKAYVVKKPKGFSPQQVLYQIYRHQQMHHQ